MLAGFLMQPDPLKHDGLQALKRLTVWQKGGLVWRPVFADDAEPSDFREDFMHELLSSFLTVALPALLPSLISDIHAQLLPTSLLHSGVQHRDRC